MRIPIGVLVLLLASTSVSLSRSLNTTQKTQSPVATGAVAPDFTLKDQHGRQTKLSESRGKNPVVLVFYRGYW